MGIVMGSKETHHIGKLVEFERRRIDPQKLRGFVLRVCDKLTLLNILTEEYSLNGFAVIRNIDVTRFSIFDRDTQYANRVIRLNGLRPRARPSVGISNWNTALVSAQGRFPLLKIHVEVRNPEVCYVGRVAKLTEKTVTLHEIDPVGVWDGQRRHRLEDITRLDFGGGYEDALWRVAEDN